MLSAIGEFVGVYDCSPWSATTGRRHGEAHFVQARPHARQVQAQASPPPLYTPEQRRLRDESAWTIVQGVLAPVQFAAFLISTVLVLRFVVTGEGYGLATGSILVKTSLLYIIMVTGAFWERAVFGRFLFAPAFFWEDLFSFLVIGLHTAYVAALLTGALPASQLMLLALTAYASYVVNAAQFVLKLRAARLSTTKAMQAAQ